MPVPPTSISAATITSQAMPIEMRMPVRMVGAAAGRITRTAVRNVPISSVRATLSHSRRTLITPNARFDKYLNGDASALSAVEKDGLRVFMEKGCAGCHTGINLGGTRYAPFGVMENPGAELLPPDDKGRFAVTKTVMDEYVYKVPTLRNIALTAPYFHTGRAWDLRQAVAVMGTSQLGATLSDAETDAVTAFLETLTGDQPRIVHPILPPSVAATPRPQP